MAKEKFPKEILVRHESAGRGEEDFLVAETRVEDIPEDCGGTQVAIYKLEGVLKMKVQKELVS